MTPYELTATRKFVRDPAQKGQQLLLASLSADETIDLLDVLESIVDLDALESADRTKQFECLDVRRVDRSQLAMVFALDVAGEREVVHDGDDPARPVVFTKGSRHVTRIHSVCLVWRPVDEGPGLLLVHSPWNRGGSKSQVVRQMQRALDSVENTKAKLHADAMIPAKALERILRNANATKITYRRSTGIVSTFSGNRSSAPAELDVVVKGTSSIGYRDNLTKALRATANREKFFTVRVRDEQGSSYHAETFDDVIVDIPIGGSTRQYSMRHDSIPTLGFNLTGNINNVYFRLPDDDPEAWPTVLLDDVVPLLQRVLRDVRRDL